MDRALVLQRLREIFGEDSFDWFDKAYLMDWIVVGCLWVASYVIDLFPVYHREFSPDDPLISHDHHHNQVPSWLNHVVAFAVPAALMALVGLKRRSLMDIHHGALALASSRGWTAVITEFVKHLVGRLRPDFLYRCKWDAATAACTGKLSTIEEGRKSFPSGHSSTAFSGMMLLSLWIAGQTGAWCFSCPAPVSIVPSRMLRFLIAMLPLVWATWVAISRLEDYRHHKEDVIVGSLLGAGFATISYLMYWPSPLLAEVSHLPRVLYRDDGRRERDHFRLYSVDEGGDSTV